VAAIVGGFTIVGTIIYQVRGRWWHSGLNRSCRNLQENDPLFCPEC